MVSFEELLLAQYQWLSMLVLDPAARLNAPMSCEVDFRYRASQRCRGNFC